MKIWKHKSIDIPLCRLLDDLTDFLNDDKPLPGLAVDVSEEGLVVSPLDTFTFRPDDDDDYELVVYDHEDDEDDDL